MHSYYTGVDALKNRIRRQNKWHGTALERSRVVHRRWHLSESMMVTLSGNVKVTSGQPHRLISPRPFRETVLRVLRAMLEVQ